ncbi:MAG: hypothetical protein JO303_08420 [Caulobacteraceae bacterium]|nr:hypothetical protein [Caulobacteraceae bacterium]
MTLASDHLAKPVREKSDRDKPDRDEEVDRNLALLAYGLMFFAVFFAGAPALVGALIAYARRGQAGPLIARHHRFQIFIFWVGLALMLAAALAALAASFWMAAEVIETAARGRWEGWTVIPLPDLRIDRTTIVLFVSAGVLGALSGLWMLATSAYGFVRLATRRDIHHTAP